MATLHEDEAFAAPSEPSTGGLHAPRGPNEPPHSPAFSLDSLLSRRQPMAAVQAPSAPTPVSPRYSSGGIPAWWGSDSPLAQAADPLWGPDCEGDPQQPAAQAQQCSRGFAPQDMKTSRQHLETATYTPRAGHQSAVDPGMGSGPFGMRCQLRCSGAQAGALLRNAGCCWPACLPASQAALVATPCCSASLPAGANQGMPAPPPPRQVSRQVEPFLLSADSFTSAGSPALFTQDSGYDSPPAPTTDQAQPQPSRFAEARRTAADARPGWP